MGDVTLGVVGAGTMGQGIAQVAATSGIEVTLFDIAEASLARAQAAIDKSMTRLVAKERLSDTEKQAALTRLATTDKLEDLAACTVIIEAAPEQPELKEKLFRDLDAIAPRAILASNTSS